MSAVTTTQALHAARQHHQAGRLAEAEAIYRAVLARDDHCVDALHYVGVIELQTGRLAAAVEHIGGAATLAPNQASIQANLGLALRSTQKTDDAIACFRRALVLDPGHVNAWNSLGNTLAAQHKFDEAIACYRRALNLAPHHASIFSNLGAVLQDQGELDEALVCVGKSADLQPGLADSHKAIALVHRDRGELADSVAAYRRALALEPHRADIHSDLILTLHYHDGTKPADIVAEHSIWNERHARPLGRLRSAHANDRTPTRRLRVGYISCDFRDHVVGRNLLPLFEQHDHTRFEIVSYAHVISPDHLTARFRAASDHWRDITSLDDEQLANTVRDDQVDVLVDLALHTAKNRLLAFARKPAPIQLSFAGYPAGTGLDAIDYHLTDPYLEPPTAEPAADSDAAYRLSDTFWCYAPVGANTTVSPLPASLNGFVTFGCLNAFYKTNARVIQLWARVLQELPSSRLLMLAPSGSPRQRLVDRFASAGVAADRLELVNRLSRSDYLAQYQRIDVGLDAFPYNGHTTSLDAFWMGVPVVTMVGSTSVGRAGWSQLSNLGLTELAAHTEDEFVRIASSLAGDLPRLSALRTGLRERMQRSPLMDAPRFARAIEDAYRTMWTKWCTQPAQPLAAG